MARGHEDWGVKTDQFVFVDVDTNELAARLESPVTYNRSGRVVHIDRCIYGTLTWEANGYGTGSAIALDTTHAFRNEKSLKLTAGSDGANLANIGKQIPLPSLSKVGAEFTWSPWGLARVVGVQIAYFDGAELHDFRCNLNFSLGYMRYLDDVGAWISHTAIVDFRDKAAYWHTFKLIVDLENLVYDKFMVDNLTYDLDGLSGQKSTDAAPHHIQVSISCWGDAGENRSLFVNDFIFTIDEP